MRGVITTPAPRLLAASGASLVLVGRDGEVDFSEREAIEGERLLEMLHNSCAVAEYASQA